MATLGLGRRIRRDGGDSSILVVVHLTENYQLSCGLPREVGGSESNPVFSSNKLQRGSKKHLNSFGTLEKYPCIAVTGLIKLQHSQMLVVSMLVDTVTTKGLYTGLSMVFWIKIKV